MSTISFSDKTYIMGILNVTPDSFSDGGKYNSVELAIQHAKEMVEAGADIIDIGGESTRPGFKKVEEVEELERVIPIIEAVRKYVDVPISIDTYKSAVAKEAIKVGATIINDIWGAKEDPKIAEVAAEYQVPIILMHNRHNLEYGDIIKDMISDLNESIEICHQAGVLNEQIILDPGIGFAKTYLHSIEVMRRLDELKEMGYPLLLGTSRKSFISKILDLPVDERVEGTGASICLGIMKGCDIIRVHDVLEMGRMAKMMDVMLGKGASNG